MKLENELPENYNGWLIAGKNVLYGNSPMINLSLLKSVTYYEYNENDNNGIPRESDKGWYIDFAGERWYYKGRDEMVLDYYEITAILVGDRNKKNRKTI